MECECIDPNQCLWSADLIQKIEIARVAGDFKLWNSYSNQFRKQICSFEEKKVCCCQSDKQYVSNQEEILSKKHGKHNLIDILSSGENYIVHLRFTNNNGK